MANPFDEVIKGGTATLEANPFDDIESPKEANPFDSVAPTKAVNPLDDVIEDKDELITEPTGEVKPSVFKQLQDTALVLTKNLKSLNQRQIANTIKTASEVGGTLKDVPAIVGDFLNIPSKIINFLIGTNLPTPPARSKLVREGME